MPDILLLNGPNLGSLGTREPAVYGTTTLPEIERRVADRLAVASYGLRAEQHDCEGALIGALRENADAAGAIVNPGALMIAGWSLRDALADFPAPWAEVHISNVWARESFRHNSVLSPLAVGVIAGFGVYGYELAADALVQHLAAAASVDDRRS
ncbi:MAG: type II 3-dehydroquinate dehydratase [Actinocatenispora sp.]